MIVIGYGNPLRGDDGLGWHVAQRLIELDLERVEVITCHQLTPELAESLSRAGRAIFVDASLEHPGGDVEVRDLTPAIPSGTFTHHIEAAHLLGLAQVLYGRTPGALVVSVGISSFGYAEEISPEVEASIPRVLEAILRVLE